MRRYGLRDDQWDRIKDFLPGRDGHVGGTAADNRLFVEAFSIDFAPGSLGAISRGALAIGRLSINASIGRKVRFLSVFSRFWPVITTTRT